MDREVSINDQGREAEIVYAMQALCEALAEGADPDETIDSTQIRDLIGGRLDPAAESRLLDQLHLPDAVRRSLSGLRYSKADRDIARRAVVTEGGHPSTSGLDPLGVVTAPIYHLDGPHGASRPSGAHGAPTFGANDRVELIARPAGSVSTPPPVSLWAGPRSGSMHKVEVATFQRDSSGVYRVLVPASAIFYSPGRWRLMLVIGDEMPPSRAETTESLVQVLQTWAEYAPDA